MRGWIGYIDRLRLLLGPKYVVKKGKTPVWSREDARRPACNRFVAEWKQVYQERKGGTTLCPTIKSNFLTVKGKENCS